MSGARAGSRALVPAAFWLSLAAAALALWLSGQAGDAWEVVRAARPWPLLLVLLCGVALPAIHALRWRVVMRAQGHDLLPVLAADLTVSASLVNYASPGYLGAPAKAFLANRAAGVPYKRSLLSMAFEQGLDFLLLLAGSLLALALLGPARLGDLVPDADRGLQFAALAALAIALVSLVVLASGRIRRAAGRIVEAFRALGGAVDRRLVAVLTLTYWLAQAAVVGLLLWALRLPSGPLTLLALATIPLLVGQVTPLPGGVGAREATIVAFSGVVGIDASDLLGLAVLQRVLLVAALPLSLLLLRATRRARFGGAA